MPNIYSAFILEIILTCKWYGEKEKSSQKQLSKAESLSKAFGSLVGLT